MAYDPLANITALNRQQQPQTQGGFNLIQLLKDATYFPRGAMGALFEVGRGGLSLIPGIGDRAYTTKEGKAKQNPFISEQELGNIQKNPVKEATKLFASGASYAVPFGKGIKAVQSVNPLLRAILNTGTKAALPGAAVGGLQSFSTDKDVIGGAISGGATAGVLKGTGNLGQGLLKMGGNLGRSSLQQAVVRPFVRPSATAAQTEAELTKEAKNLFGSAFSSAQGMREKSTSIFNKVQAKISQLLPKIKKTVSLEKDVLPKLSENFDDVINKGADFTAKQEEIINKLTQKATNGKLTATAISELKNKYSSILSRAFDRIDKGNPLSQQEEATLAAWEALDDIMLNAFPEIKKLTLQQSVLHRLAPGLEKSAKQGIPGNFLGLPLKVATRPVQAAQNALGGVLEGAGNLANKQAPNPLMQFLFQGASRLGGDTPELEGEVQGASIPEEQGLGVTGQLPSQESGFSQGSAGLLQPSYSPANLDLRDVLSLIANNPQGADLFRYLYEQGQKAQESTLSAAEKKDLQKYSQAENVIAQLESSLPTLEGRGRVSGNIQQVLSKAGLATNVKVYNDFKDGVVIPLVRSLGESGALSNIDVERAISLVPAVTDTPKEASGKLGKLKSLLKANKESLYKVSQLGGNSNSLLQYLGL